MIQTIQDDISHMEEEIAKLEQNLRDQAASFLHQAKAIKEKRKNGTTRTIKIHGSQSNVRGPN